MTKTKKPQTTEEILAEINKLIAENDANTGVNKITVMPVGPQDVNNCEACQ
jgi:hypothetical protein